MTRTDLSPAREELADRIERLADRVRLPATSLLDALEARLPLVQEPGIEAGPIAEIHSGPLSAAGVNLSGPSEAEQIRSTRELLSRLISESLSLDDAAERLNSAPEALRAKLRRGTVTGVQLGHTWVLPSWQLDGDRLLPHLRDILKRASGIHPLALQRWMMSPDPDLVIGGDAVSPARWLASGGPIGPVLQLVDDLPAAS